LVGYNFLNGHSDLKYYEHDMNPNLEEFDLTPKYLKDVIELEQTDSESSEDDSSCIKYYNNYDKDKE